MRLTPRRIVYIAFASLTLPTRVKRAVRARASSLRPARWWWLALCLCVPAQAEMATVRHAIDGDSFVLTDGRQVRLIGINAPEIGVDGRPDQPLARAAQRRAAQLVEGRAVRLTFDQERADRHGRMLAYVTLADGNDLPMVLAREGLAWCVAIPPNTARAAAYCAAEREARAARRGIWAEPSLQPIPATNVRPSDTGFRLVSGTVARIGRSRHAVYLDLSSQFTVVIPLQAWQQFPSIARPAPGQALVARGWVTEYKKRMRMRIAHPAMLEIVS